MLVGQAIVETKRNSRRLIGRSESVDVLLAGQMVNLAPAPNDLVHRQDGCMHFFQPEDNTIIVSRTLVSQDRGIGSEMQCATTKYLVIRPNQVKAFQNNVALLLLVALSEGTLFVTESFRDELPEVELSVNAYSFTPYGHSALDDQFVFEIKRGIEIHGRVAITGLKNALSFLASYFDKVDFDERLQNSFSIGAHYCDSLPVKLILLPKFDDRTNKRLVASQIRTMSVARNPQVVAG